MSDIYNRTELIIGKEKIDLLKKATVCICGIGGVGSYTLEALARIGIGTIIIIDKDEVDVTNINRQLIAMLSTVGKDKVAVAKERIADINKDINVITIKENIMDENITNILNKFSIDYLVDCVDNIEAKIAIMKYAVDNKIKSISCMGMGNKLNPLDIEVTDIYKTEVCPLAKIIRKKLKELNIKRQKVVFSKEIPIRNEQKRLGSVSFVPSVAGLIIASEVVKDLIK